MDRGDIAKGLSQRGLVKLTLFGQGNRGRNKAGGRMYIETREGGGKKNETKQNERRMETRKTKETKAGDQRTIDPK